MSQAKTIEQFVERHAPSKGEGAIRFARHTEATLASFLNVEPEEIIAFCEAGLLQAEEPWPGAPSLRFSQIHLCAIRRELARQHAEDTIELCEGKSSRELHQILEMSWDKRSARVIELTRKS